MHARRIQTPTRWLLTAWPLLAVFLLPWGPAAPMARAASYVVTSLADDGDGTLRWAIEQANTNPGADTIIFSVSGTITLLSTLPAITDAAGLTIDGGATITLSGDNQVRVVAVASGATLTVKNLTIIDGRDTILGGGGIRNEGALTVTHSTFAGNHSPGGGGIRNEGALTVTHSTFGGNSADFGGGIYNNGGALTVTHSTFGGNSATSGGGIYNNGGALTVTHSTFASAIAGTGGGIYNNGGALTVTNSTFGGNSATFGGGIFNNYVLEVTNSTFASNSATFGGGIYSLDLTAVTTLNNTIVAHSLSGGNCSGSIFDGGGNLSYPDATCPGINSDPRLEPLADNGGPTRTMALALDSPAIDAAVDANCPDTDQRGVERPQGAGCDSGAYELFRLSFSGFFPPVDSPPTLNVAKAGRGIPVKFSLDGDHGLDIFAMGYPASQPIVCDTRLAQNSIEETVTAGGSSLTYDASTDQYTYVWKTDKNWSGTCRRLIVRLTDLTNHVADFTFVK